MKVVVEYMWYGEDLDDDINYFFFDHLKSAESTFTDVMWRELHYEVSEDDIEEALQDVCIFLKNRYHGKEGWNAYIVEEK
jgi:hypothetical protein